MDTEAQWLSVNEGLWNEMAALHVSTELYDVDGLVRGRDPLRPWEDDELGPVRGLDLVHLQCHIGTDTIAWARRGANVVGLDFSANAISAARDIAGRCDVDIEWVHANVYDAPSALAARTFDVVYTGVGALGWLPDLDEWATVVRSLLRPGGVLYLVELHPMWVALVGDGQTICQPAIAAPFTCWDEQGRTSYADPTHQLEHTAGFERLHCISDLLSAVLSAGLVIELFHEFDRTPSPTPWLEIGTDGLYGFPPGRHPFPVAYSLRARLPISNE